MFMVYSRKSVGYIALKGTEISRIENELFWPTFPELFGVVSQCCLEIGPAGRLKRLIN